MCAELYTLRLETLVSSINLRFFHLQLDTLLKETIFKRDKRKGLQEKERTLIKHITIIFHLQA